MDKLHTILLYEADLNYMKKCLGREMMGSAERWGQLAVEQYGSRWHHRAIEQAVNKRVTFDLLLQKRVPASCGVFADTPKWD